MDMLMEIAVAVVVSLLAIVAGHQGWITQKQKRAILAAAGLGGPLRRGLAKALDKAHGEVVDDARLKVISDAIAYVEKNNPELVKTATGTLANAADGLMDRAEAELIGLLEGLTDGDPRKPRRGER